MTAPPRLILASSSPRRRELLRSLGVPFRVVPSRVEEIPRDGETPYRFVRRAAREKCEEVSARYPSSIVLAADTIVVTEGRILGKPGNGGDAFRMLSMLAGRDHVVWTAVCLIMRDAGYRDERCERTRVRFRDLTEEEIGGYVRTGEPADKAGAYAAQGAGHLLIDRISGSYTNVVGMPMTRVLEMLRRADAVTVSPNGPGWYAFSPGKGAAGR